MKLSRSELKYASNCLSGSEFGRIRISKLDPEQLKTFASYLFSKIKAVYFALGTKISNICFWNDMFWNVLHCRIQIQ